jgi:hypothetical protein
VRATWRWLKTARARLELDEHVRSAGRHVDVEDPVIAAIGDEVLPFYVRRIEPELTAGVSGFVLFDISLSSLLEFGDDLRERFHDLAKLGQRLPVALVVAAGRRREQSAVPMA